MILTNLVSFVGQLDEHAPFLTVQETFDFAANCRTGVHKKQSPNEDRVLSENLTIEGLDLAVCRDTFVGDANNRGVSGGQRRRVSVGEMLVGQSPVACADEISTGLDAAVTYDIVHSIVKFAKAAGTTRLVSLLQPGPETFSLFDEVILLAEGHLAFAGPIEKAADYFANLGYKQPVTMDVADFLQSVTTPDGNMMFDAEKSPNDKHYSAAEFAEAFKSSARYEKIISEQASPLKCNWKRSQLDSIQENDEENAQQTNDHANRLLPEYTKREYMNSFWTSTMLNVKRHVSIE
jgi:ABC-type multidrug transport system ATPase subunit